MRPAGRKVFAWRDGKLIELPANGSLVCTLKFHPPPGSPLNPIVEVIRNIKAPVKQAGRVDQDDVKLER